LSDILGGLKDFVIERSPLLKVLFGSGEEEDKKVKGTQLKQNDLDELLREFNTAPPVKEPSNEEGIKLKPMMDDSEQFLSETEEFTNLADPTVVDLSGEPLRETSFQPLVDKDKAPPIEFGVLDGVEPSNPTDKKLIDQIMLHEGVRSSVYRDTKGIPTVGVGFNLTKPGARELIEGVGANYDDIRSGRAALSRQQIVQLMSDDIETAINDARSLFSNFDELDGRRQRALIDLAFNMGRTRLAKFRETRRAIENFDFERASLLLRKTRWFRQVGVRALNVINLIKGNEIV
jgi:GH24 family phage-related lysozyme (muramidase)